MQPLSPGSITVDEIELRVLKEKNISLSVLRLDKIHAIISGNKWFKLKYYLEKAAAEKKDFVVTFGGAYSNHILATAAAGKMFGYKTVAIIRGEKPGKLSHTLSQAEELGMKLFFLNRDDYRNKVLPAKIEKRKDEFFVIIEGGYGIDGANGAKDILTYCAKENYSHIVCAVGTTTMMAGLVKACLPEQKVTGLSVLKNNLDLEIDLNQLLSAEEKKKDFTIIHDYHFGGYAKYTPELIHFMNEFYQQTLIPSDFVYTGKLFFGMMEIINKNSFSAGSKILVIHSGGLQGNLSLPKGMLIF